MYAGIVFAFRPVDASRNRLNPFCPYSNDIASFIDELNSMGINLRVENYDKQKKCHFVRRLFCLPKDKGQLKQLLLYLENKVIVCKVAEKSLRLKVKEHF